MPSAAPKSIRVQYFAMLREERGCSEETVTTNAGTVRQLYQELQNRYGFRLPTDVLRVAINEVFGQWDSVLNDSDTVVFIPPVAGG